jgi:divalent metal cation (Fe/Co/Zn/Cd) transporter
MTGWRLWLTFFGFVPIMSVALALAHFHHEHWAFGVAIVAAAITYICGYFDRKAEEATNEQ